MVSGLIQSQHGPSHSPHAFDICVFLEVSGREFSVVHPRSSTQRTTLKEYISSRRVMGHLSVNVSDSTVLSGLGAGHSLTSGRTPTRPFGWTWRWRAGRVRNSEILTSITKSTEHAPLRRFFKAAVDGLQLVFDRSLVTSVQPKSLLAQMQEAVADCDDVSSDGSLMLLSPPHDIPEASLPAESSMDLETRDEVSPVVMPRRVTPANRPLQHLEAGRLGASTPQHVRSRPAVPDLCIASSNLLSVMDPLPMDRLSRHTVAEIRLWPAADRHDILAVANRDVVA